MKPNWSFWKHIPQAKIWKWVALSVDIEPINNPLDSHNDLNENELEEYRKRLKITIANVKANPP